MALLNYKGFRKVNSRVVMTRPSFRQGFIDYMKGVAPSVERTLTTDGVEARTYVKGRQWAAVWKSMGKTGDYLKGRWPTTEAFEAYGRARRMDIIL